VEADDPERLGSQRALDGAAQSLVTRATVVGPWYN